MSNWFQQKDKTFSADFDKFLQKRSGKIDVRSTVATIISDTRKNGDKALIAQAKKFDGVALDSLRLPKEQIQELAKTCPKEVLDALSLAAARIERWHKKQMPKTIEMTDEDGVWIQQRWNAIESVGLYVPGGTAVLPSSVLMNALPAKIAGCERIAVAVPANSTNDPLLMAAFAQVNIEEVWQMGGAGAIAAFAYGTQSIPKVNKIVGPGNAYVAEAKRQVFGEVGIDMIAGPSEILIIADNNNKSEWVAADLLSQAEHDELAQSILICTDKHFAQKVEANIKVQLENLPRKKIATKSWKNYGAIIIVDNLEQAIPIADKIAAEHLQLLVPEPKNFAIKIRNAGTIFIGAHTPEVLGDYLIGTNHVLPTSQAARFSSGLSVYDFMKRTSVTHCPEDSFATLGGSAEILAKAEGLQAHAYAASVRLKPTTAPTFHNVEDIKDRATTGAPTALETKVAAKAALGAFIAEITFGQGLENPRREELEFERKAALFDLLEANLFDTENNPPEGHRLTLSCEEGRLVFVNQGEVRFNLALAPLSRVVRDYFLLCGSYYDAVKSASVYRVEELDKERRALHNEGAEILLNLLTRRGSVKSDNNTTRRLFTLICVMYMR